MINFNLSREVNSTTRNVNPSTLVTSEGCALMVDSSNPNSVAMSAGASTDVFAGISLSQQMPITVAPKVETLTVASDGTVTLSRSPNAGTIRVLVAGAVFTAAAAGTAQGTLTATQYAQTVSGGNILQFPAAQVGVSIVAYYRFAPTYAEVITIQGNIIPGGDSGALLNVVGVVTIGDIYTDQYDTTADWTQPGVRTGANGLFTTAGSGPVIANCRILAQPSSTQPFLGLSIGGNG